MSRSLGCELPPELFERLSGRDLDAVAAKVIQLLTVDGRGWPHPALLSYFEVVAADRRRIRLATYKTSTTSANMRQSGQATLVVIDVRTAFYIKGRVRPLAGTLQAATWSTPFECLVEDVLADEVDEAYEPGAYLSSGVTYYSPQRAADLERARALLAELLEVPSPPDDGVR